MGKVGVFIKTASTILATSVALLTAMRENPQIAEGIDSAIDKLKKATNSQNPKLRFDAKLAAIVAAADAVEQTFPGAAEPAGWRRQAQALRVRGELAWHSNTGGHRRKAMKALNAETAEVLSQVNARLIDLQGRFSPELDA